MPLSWSRARGCLTLNQVSPPGNAGAGSVPAQEVGVADDEPVDLAKGVPAGDAGWLPPQAANIAATKRNRHALILAGARKGNRGRNVRFTSR